MRSGTDLTDEIETLRSAVPPPTASFRTRVLEEAFNVRPHLAKEWSSAQFREGYYSGLEAFRQAIRRLIDAEPGAEKLAGEQRKHIDFKEWWGSDGMSPQT